MPFKILQPKPFTNLNWYLVKVHTNLYKINEVKNITLNEILRIQSSHELFLKLTYTSRMQMYRVVHQLST